MLLFPVFIEAQIFPPFIGSVGEITPILIGWTKPNYSKTYCDNGNFEDGTFGSSFSGYTSSRQGLSSPSQSSEVSGFVSGRHEIVTTGYVLFLIIMQEHARIMSL